jgi:hypothetical protein
VVFVKTQKRTLNKTLPLDDVVVVVAVVARLEERAKTKALFDSYCDVCVDVVCIFLSLFLVRACVCGSFKVTDARESVFTHFLLKGTIKRVIQ